ncbi:hypothetical protein N7474_007578 [Penicillium riverlandense]|uniref:uncharacterized protein n=1 Tax=Penicillium riverlandense TaxID=1903569 RepID=UPI0025473AE3|nr:uncharacterized protein N7474_007578 [Penicillium riverlandense]KAJ5811277.1 hypothetical protein N7474_007578 [Penicillium riverlandense]
MRPLSVLPFLFTISLAFDAQSQWAWIDESCHDKIPRLNLAGEDYLKLTEAAYNALGEGITERTSRLLGSLFGTTDPQGLVIKNRYKDLKGLGVDGSKIPYSLYCDGSAFEWTTTYVECEREGEEIPGGGMWYATRGPENAPVLYIPGTKREHYCPSGVGGASIPGGSHIILCPEAFQKRASLDHVKDVKQPAGTSLADMESTGSILLHEITHAKLSTQDYAYGLIKCLLLSRNPMKSKKNADTYEYFSLGIYLDKTNWRGGIARDSILATVSQVGFGTRDAKTGHGGERLHTPEPLTDLEQAKELCKELVLSMYHLSGTCAMMRREDGGVVDSHLKVYGTTNVRVVDASIFPLVPRGNIQATVFAVAEKAADMIKMG